MVVRASAPTHRRTVAHRCGCAQGAARGVASMVESARNVGPAASDFARLNAGRTAWGARRADAAEQRAACRRPHGSTRLRSRPDPLRQRRFRSGCQEPRGAPPDHPPAPGYCRPKAGLLDRTIACSWLLAAVLVLPQALLVLRPLAFVRGCPAIHDLGNSQIDIPSTTGTTTPMRRMQSNWKKRPSTRNRAPAMFPCNRPRAAGRTGPTTCGAAAPPTRASGCRASTGASRPARRHDVMMETGQPCTLARLLRKAC